MGYVHTLMHITRVVTAACNLLDTGKTSKVFLKETLFQDVAGTESVTFQGGLSHHHLTFHQWRHIAWELS